MAVGRLTSMARYLMYDKKMKHLRTLLDIVSTDEESLFDNEEEIDYDEESLFDDDEEYNSNLDSSTDSDTGIEVDLD
ncbi:hypothetical protein AVEN_90105-1 [Araneus ventricosus]|uniref:Uncharacterized protein n=1 Tax=Araneus ventricosus TaxID=182803 RepID=A0A4Y2U4B1_ARAVE|nr:hypothetical protein AVEN_90105-1 [Araneus ventricosus]